MGEVDFLSRYQKATKRDYVARVVEHDKAECATVARQWGAEYWDGPRQFGYGGNRYDGRWLPIARDIARHYGLKAGDRVLDIGCGKAFLLYELTRAVPGLEVAGLDISRYGLENAKEEVRPFLKLGNCTSLPFDRHSFDLVFTINTFHNLEVFDLKQAVQEVERVGKSRKWICVESFRNEPEKANLLYWQLTCYSFYTPTAWAWLYKEWSYTGDYGFIYFE
jgi:protein-L-isoaspartate(D-aspartate) O-methyltransferase